SAPQIRTHIGGGSGIITGTFTPEETNNLAVLLRAGALPAKMEFLEERTVGPELGQDSIDAGRVAAIVGTVAVVVLMIASYGLFGVFASVALGLNLSMLFAILSAMGATLTL
ncbi:MAG: protein translocase subunit SecD, partial [Rhodobacteraceae bacterium]|nr:protein translocase subunit SecD [Paracoccaceae bacterium]